MYLKSTFSIYRDEERERDFAEKEERRLARQEAELRFKKKKTSAAVKEVSEKEVSEKEVSEKEVPVSEPEKSEEI